MKKFLLLSLTALWTLSALFPALAVEPAEQTTEANTAFEAFQDIPVDESTYQEEAPSGAPGPVPLSQGQPGSGTVDDLYEYWEEQGYPDYVSFAYCAGGEVGADNIVYDYWEIGLVDAGEDEKQEILSLASPTCLVTFQGCFFTHAQKLEAYDRLSALDDKNILDVIFGKNTDTVIVVVPEGLEKEYAALLIRDMGFGAVVSVISESGVMTDLEDIVGVGQDTAGLVPGSGTDILSPNLTPGIGTAGAEGRLWYLPVILLLAAALLLALRLRLRPVPVKGTRQASAKAPMLSGRQTAYAVRNSMTEPDDALYQAILTRISHISS